jgi:hypothetical protein
MTGASHDCCDEGRMAFVASVAAGRAGRLIMPSPVVSAENAVGQSLPSALVRTPPRRVVAGPSPHRASVALRI